jgi:hypothetical protein
MVPIDPAPQLGLREKPMAKKAEDPNAEYSNRNATGPRTESGKKRASRNATKFGIFSKETLLQGESRAEYDTLREGLWKSKQPGNEFEEILLDKMASNLWRQHRVLIAERAEIRRNSEFVEFDHEQRQLEAAEEASQKTYEQISPRIVPESVGLIWSIENPEVVARCVEILLELQQRIKDNGFDRTEDEFLLKIIYGDQGVAHLRQTLHDKYLTWFITAEVTEETRAQEGYDTPEQCKNNLLQEVGAEIRRLEQDREKRKSIEFERRQVEILRQRVPDSSGLDRLLRYATALERAFDRMLTQFDRAQRIRKGQPSPPEGGR